MEFTRHPRPTKPLARAGRPRRLHHLPAVLVVGCVVLGAITGWSAIVAAAGRAEAAQASRQPGAVTLMDGRVLEGEVFERETEVVVTVNGIATTLPRTQVASIEYGTPEERLGRRLEALPAGDVEGRLALAEDALRRGLLDLAERIADEVLAGNRNDQRAKAVVDQVQRQRRLQQSEGRGKRRDPADAAQGGRTVRATSQNTLNEDQINMVRQAELQPLDAERGRVRINFRNDVVQRYVESQPNLEFRAFNGLRDVEKALEILRRGTAEMWEDVRITSDPVSILDYLRAVEPIVLNGCATSECHGGGAAESFVLFTNPRDDATRYTNFYLLNTASVQVEPETGAFGQENVRRRLIDRESPDDSMLLTYMLPRGRTKHPHPTVEDFNGLVLDPSAEHYQAVRRWIDDSLQRMPGRGYGFEFKPVLSRQLPATQPGTQPATQPSTQPAARPGR